MADEFEEDAPRSGPGGQSEYTEELAEHICTALSYGTPLAEICRKLGIGRTTVYDWQKAHPEFAEHIARARVAGFDAIAEEALEIADNATNDWMERNLGEDAPTSYVLNGEHVQRSKLRIETRLKLLAKWDPKRYGDKVAHVGGGPDDAPIQTEQRTVFILPDNGR